jgi:LmbE family N-acetylglucosaminyl deacetylase
MAVHAHPDDEASSTGGVLALYGDEGVRTVVVTCTDGELGDAPDGSKPGTAGHDESAVVAIRRSELEASCSILGVSELETLGYHDSGMMGWPQNDAPGSFWTTPVAQAAGRLGVLLERYRPQVVVTYDANGFYGHPDHIQAHRITLAALAATRLPAKLYFPVIPASAFGKFIALFEEGADEQGPRPAEDDEVGDISTPDDLVTTYVDCTAVVDRKRAALAAHASQTDHAAFLRHGTEVFRELFGVEAFLRAADTTGATLPEDDLFAGLR